MSIIWALVVGGIIGFIAGGITGKGKSMGCLTNIAAGLLGSFAGESLFGSFGPKLAGMAIIPSVIGAIILVLLVSLFVKKSD